MPLFADGERMGVPEKSPKRADEDEASEIATDSGMGNILDLVERLPLIAYMDAADSASPNIWVSAQATQMLGYPPEEWRSRADFFLTILHPDDRERVVAETAHTIATGDKLETEYRVLRSDGSVAWLHDEAVLVRDAAGAPLCLQGYMLDITERKRREVALVASDAIVASSFDAIVSRTTEGIVTGWNRAAERLFGYSAAEMIGHTVDLLLPGESSVLEYVDARMRRGEIVEPLEAACLRKDGTRIEVESTVSPLFDSSGRDRRLLLHHARHHRAQARPGARGRAGGAARLRRRRRRAPACAGSPGAFRRAARRRRARLHPPVGPRRLASAPGRRPEPPGGYCAAIDRVAIGASVGSCGTAAYRREAVCVSDIASDPLWADFRDVALARASVPAGRLPSSRPTARCSARSRSTTTIPASPERTTANSSSSRRTSPASPSSAGARRKRRARARSGIATSSRTPTSRS